MFYGKIRGYPLGTTWNIARFTNPEVPIKIAYIVSWKSHQIKMLLPKTGFCLCIPVKQEHTTVHYKNNFYNVIS